MDIVVAMESMESMEYIKVMVCSIIQVSLSNTGKPASCKAFSILILNSLFYRFVTVSSYQPNNYKSKANTKLMVTELVRKYTRDLGSVQGERVETVEAVIGYVTETPIDVFKRLIRSEPIIQVDNLGEDADTLLNGEGYADNNGLIIKTAKVKLIPGMAIPGVSLDELIATAPSVARYKIDPKRAMTDEQLKGNMRQFVAKSRGKSKQPNLATEVTRMLYGEDLEPLSLLGYLGGNPLNANRLNRIADTYREVGFRVFDPGTLHDLRMTDPRESTVALSPLYILHQGESRRSLAPMGVGDYRPRPVHLATLHFSTELGLPNYWALHTHNEEAAEGIQNMTENLATSMNSRLNSGEGNSELRLGTEVTDQYHKVKFAGLLEELSV
ncbi:hypothetical protein ACFL1B_06395 [Nanoarchaeota archaeon]